MPIITISRQYGSGGSAVGQRVAQRLEWSLVDNQFVNRVAERAGLSPDEVSRHEERAPSLIDRLARSLAIAAPDVLVGAPVDAGGTYAPEAAIHRVTQAVIWEVVQVDNAVIVGRGAQSLLEHHKDALHVFIVAPRATRLAHAAQRLDKSKADVERILSDIDEGRRRYVDTFYRRAWGDPTHYHLVLNTGLLGIDVAADIVVTAAHERGWDLSQTDPHHPRGTDRAQNDGPM